MSGVTTLLPSNATPLERALETAVVEALDVPVVVGTLGSPADIPEALLPWLAWQLSVDHWDEGWTSERKRSVVAASIEVHREKGTARSLRRALDALGHELRLQEAHEFAGDAGALRVDVFVRDEPITAEAQTSILRAIEDSKNVRSWLDRLRLYLSSRTTARVVAGVRAGEIVGIPAEPYTPPPPELGDPSQ